MANLLRLLLVLVLLGTASARSKAFAPRLNRQLSIRGGAGPLDSTLVAKAAIGSLLVQGTISTLAPEKAIEQYGSDPTLPSAVFMRRIGVSALSIAAMAFGMISKGWDVNTAAGVEAAIWSTELLKGLLNDESSAVGYDKTSMVVWLALHVACAYVYFTDASCSSTVLKSFAIFVIATCSPLAFFPTEGLKAYGFDSGKTTNIDKTYLKGLGAWTAAIGVFLLSVANGVDATKALGYAFVPPTLLCAISLFVTKDADENGTPKAPMYAWLIFNAIVVATLAID